MSTENEARRVEMLRLLAAAKANRKKLEGCSGHVFSPTITPFGAKNTCRKCGGGMSAQEIYWYVAGWRDAGNDANKVVAGWNKRVVTCNSN